MSIESLYCQFQEVSADLTQKADEYTGVLGSVRQTILDNFGQNGLIAAYIALAALVLVLVLRLTKVTFSAVKYLAIPAVALAFIGSQFLPYSFPALLPVTVAGCSLVLLFKG